MAEIQLYNSPEGQQLSLEFNILAFQKYVVHASISRWEHLYWKYGGEKMVELLLQRNGRMPSVINVVVQTTEENPAHIFQVFSSCEIVTLLRGCETLEVLDAIYVQSGPSSCKDILLSGEYEKRLSVISNINQHPTLLLDFLKVFDDHDNLEYLLQHEGETSPMSYGIVQSSVAVDALRFIKSQISSIACKALLLETDENRWPIIMALHGRFDGVLEIFTNEEQTDLLNTTARGNLKVIHCMLMSLSASQAAQYVCDNDGEQICIDHLVFPDQDGKMVFSLALERWCEEQFTSVLRVFSTNENLIMMLKDHQDATGHIAFYHMLNSQFSRRAAELIYGTIGRIEFVNLWLKFSPDEACCLVLKALQQWDEEHILKVLYVFQIEDIKRVFEKTTDDGRSLICCILQTDKSELFLSYMQRVLNRQQVMDVLFTCKLRAIGDSLKKTLEDWIYDDQDRLGEDFLPLMRKKMEWSIGQHMDSCYFLITQPSILIISNTALRPGAKIESKEICDAFSSHDMEFIFKEDLSKDQIFRAIDEHNKKHIASGQIVVIMSHGSRNNIHDNDGTEVLIDKLVEAMDRGVSPYSPKVLILQCCQTDSEAPGMAAIPSPSVPVLSAETTESTTDMSGTNLVSPSETQPQLQLSTLSENFEDGPTIDARGRPRRRGDTPRQDFQLKTSNFSVWMSTVVGEASYRNFFVPKIADAIRGLRPNECIHQAFLNAHNEMKGERWMQTAIKYETLTAKVCLRNIFRATN